MAKGDNSIRPGAAVLLAVVLGCAAAPPGPRGPLVGPGIEVATDWSFAYGRGEATLLDGSFTKGGADNYWSPVTIFPRRLEARVSPVKWADLGGEIGWLGGGLDARVGRPALEGRWLAFNVAGGLDTGEVGPFKDTKAVRSKWIRLEAYPPTPFWRPNTRLVLAAGIHGGTFYHQLADPRPQPVFVDGVGAPPAVQVIRNETRLETSLGLFLQPGNRVGSLLFTVSPYFVLDAGAPGPGCAGCTTADVASYRQDWGIVFVVRIAARRGF